MGKSYNIDKKKLCNLHLYKILGSFDNMSKRLKLVKKKDSER